jgi:Domain of unknown function (DUF222)
LSHEIGRDRIVRMSEQRQLPEDFEAIPVGPELASLLASVDREVLSDKDRLRLLHARHRLVSHLQGELYADLHAVSRDEEHPWTAAETVASVLRWTPPEAEIELEHARRLVEDLPALRAALVAGDIDVPKALVILEALATLELSLARQVVDRLIAEASGREAN